MFGAQTFSGDSNVNVEVKQDGSGEHMFSVTPDNSLVYQSADLKGGRKVDVSVSGSGCALVQVCLKSFCIRTLVEVKCIRKVQVVILLDLPRDE
ncbi:hypothetical protein DPMN_107725 [Dreissena polymorpha]|uniref:Uncharacterized protein n=1 Tax=Dreissena polymorpha TaxID=45954 RepID=A0A9D4K7Q5_DREPO|nr:hypothetical protein DPMN_107725 [Dreissena polymorpha]